MCVDCAHAPSLFPDSVGLYQVRGSVATLFRISSSARLGGAFQDPRGRIDGIASRPSASARSGRSRLTSHGRRVASCLLPAGCRGTPARLPGGRLGTQRLSSVVPPHVGARYSTQAYPIFAKSVRPLCVRSMSWSPSWMSEYPRKNTVCGLSLYESSTWLFRRVLFASTSST